jgi:hypothetical protein
MATIAEAGRVGSAARQTNGCVRVVRCVRLVVPVGSGRVWWGGCVVLRRRLSV